LNCFIIFIEILGFKTFFLIYIKNKKVFRLGEGDTEGLIDLIDKGLKSYEMRSVKRGGLILGFERKIIGEIL
jgi:hypothetical protein